MTTINDELYFAYQDSQKLKVLKRKQKNSTEVQFDFLFALFRF